jgi:hypothetical protein
MQFSDIIVLFDFKAKITTVEKEIYKPVLKPVLRSFKN